MKKIYILAGVVLFFVFVIMVWIFFFDFFDFASTLGDKSSDIALDEKSKFIGTWETTYIEGDERFVGYNGIYIFSTDQTGTIGGLVCTWEIIDNKLIIQYYGGIATLTYDYEFSNDGDLLVLTNTEGTLNFRLQNPA